MKNDVYEMMNKVHRICDDYVYEIEGKIKGIISGLEEIINEQNYTEAAFQNPSSELIVFTNEERRKDFEISLNNLLEKAHNVLDAESDHLSVSLLRDFREFDNKKEVDRLKRYVDWNKEIIEKFHKSFQDVVTYIKFLQDNYGSCLNDYWNNRLNEEIKQTVQYMNGFYNGEYQTIEEINKKVDVIKNSKR